MYQEKIIQNLSELEVFAKTLSGFLFKGFLLCLEGDLGAGKTTFTKFIGKNMGITDVINSPTFTILKIYENSLPLYHMDVYRLEGAMEDYELEEFIYGDGVCVVEWYKNIINSMPEEKLIIEIEIIDENKRLLKIEGIGRYERIVKAISNWFSN